MHLQTLTMPLQELFLAWLKDTLTCRLNQQLPPEQDGASPHQWPQVEEQALTCTKKAETEMER